MKNENNEVSDLTEALNNCKKMIDIAIASGQMSLANQLLGTQAKLAHGWEMSRFRSGEVLSRDAVMRVGQEIGAALVDVLKRRKVVGFETIVDEVMENITCIVQSVSNDPPRLEYEQ